jgi:CBS domain-containing protein
MKRVEEILREKKNTRIVTIRMRETLATALALMQRDNVSALVVKDVCRTEGNVVVGLFSERDVAIALATHGASALAMPVYSLLNRPLVSCTVDHGVESVLRLMDEHQVRLLPVLDGGVLIGAISLGDIIGHLFHTTITKGASLAEPREWSPSAQPADRLTNLFVA